MSPKNLAKGKRKSTYLKSVNTLLLKSIQRRKLLAQLRDSGAKEIVLRYKSLKSYTKFVATAA